jgi:methyl-accepting chemotaxis protein
MNVSRMKLSQRLVALLSILMLSFAIYGAWSFKVLSHLKVNGPVYQRIVQGKDLIADILPPLEYIIESYLVSLQLMAAPPAQRAALVDNFKSLKKDYDIRHDFWAKEDLDVDADLKLTHIWRLCRPKIDLGVLLALPTF